MLGATNHLCGRAFQFKRDVRHNHNNHGLQRRERRRPSVERVLHMCASPTIRALMVGTYKHLCGRAFQFKRDVRDDHVL
jgi:hypothetical protein